MTDTELLDKVKKALGISGTFQDDTVKEYIQEVVDFLTEAGVTAGNITSGVVARGVADLWNYGSGEGVFSEYFVQRATQLSYKR